MKPANYEIETLNNGSEFIINFDIFLEKNIADKAKFLMKKDIEVPDSYIVPTDNIPLLQKIKAPGLNFGKTFDDFVKKIEEHCRTEMEKRKINQDCGKFTIISYTIKNIEMKKQQNDYLLKIKITGKCYYDASS